MQRIPALAIIASDLLGLFGTSHSTADWIPREKIRAGWIYAGNGADKLALCKQQGMNALVIHAGNPETFRRRTGMYAAPS